MKSSKCPVCGTRMLVYENPPRLLCPRVAKHNKFLTGNTVGKKVGGRKKKR